MNVAINIGKSFLNMRSPNLSVMILSLTAPEFKITMLSGNFAQDCRYAAISNITDVWSDGLSHPLGARSMVQFLR